MKINEGFPIKTVSREEYEDGRDELLSLTSLTSSEDFTVRAITNHLDSTYYATDYMVRIKEIVTPRKRLLQLTQQLYKLRSSF